MIQKPYIPSKPQAPELSDKEITVSKVICQEETRQIYWPGNQNFEDELEDENDEFIEEPKLGPCISIREIQEKLPHGIDLADVYFTARFDEDYLVIEARYSEKVKLYDEQMKEYEKCHKTWLDNKSYYDQELARYEKKLKEELASLQSKKSAK